MEVIPRRIAAPWTITARMRSAPFDLPDVPSVVVHAPEGFDPRGPLHLVVFLHGWGTSAMQWVASGPWPVVRGGTPSPGLALAALHDAARTRTLLVAPQFDPRPSANWSGRFEHRGAFQRFLAELLGEVLASRLGGARTLADVASLTLVGSSAGGTVIEPLLRDDDLAGRVRNVVLFDALYTGEETFAQWLARSTPAAPRRLVTIYSRGGGTAARSEALGARFVRTGPGDVAVGPRGALADAVRGHRLVVLETGFEHVWLAVLYFTKVLQGLGLPALEPWSGRRDPKALAQTAPRAAPREVTPGETLAGAITADDALLADGSRADDYALAAPLGARVVVTARGGPSLTELRAPLDMYLEVLRDGAVVAADDDGAAALGSRVVFTSSGAGSYTVRVTTFGPGARLGPYTLQVAAARAAD